MALPLTKINLLDLCRLCLERGRALVPIFKPSDINNEVAKKIASTLSVEISASDELSQSICRECLAKVEFTYEFRSKANHSQKQLRQWLLNNKRIEEELKKSAYIIIHPVQYLIQVQVGSQYQVLGAALTGSRKEWTSPPKQEVFGVVVKEEKAELNKEQSEVDKHHSSVEIKDEVRETADDEQTVKQEELDECEEVPKEEDEADKESILKENGKAFEEDKEILNMGVFPEPTTFVAVEGGSPSALSELISETEKDSPRLYSLLLDPLKKGPPKEEPVSTERKKSFYPCTVCGKVCLTMGTLEVHLRKHTGERPFVCHICGKGFISAKGLTSHGIAHSKERPFSCDKCEATFKRKSELMTHDDIHKEGKEMECELCGFTCLRRGKMVEHKRKHTGDYTAFCPVCNKGFLYPSVMKEHMYVHSQDRPFVCGFCGFAFRKKSNLYYHTKRMHGNNGERVFQETAKCEFCSKELTLKAMRRHLRCHADVTDRFPCSYCGKLFADKGYLKIHTRIHTGERPYKCETCGKSFLSKNHIKVHMVVHTKEKPHVCELCGKKYSQRGTLNAHKKMVHVPLTIEFKNESEKS